MHREWRSLYIYTYIISLFVFCESRTRFILQNHVLDIVKQEVWALCMQRTRYYTEIVFQLTTKTSFGIATGNGLSRGVQFPAGAWDFSFLHSVQTGSEAHPTSSLVGTGGSFPGDKGAAGWSWPTAHHLVLKSGIIELCLHSPIHFNGMLLKWLSTGTNLPFTFTKVVL
jgi:hypothetical protein